MCGIAGFTWKDERLIEEMTHALAHRGPDDWGFYAQPGISLGHRRLSIIDLSRNGRQPMCNEDASVWITFNGEIYNYLRLRNELISAGHVFHTETDTEVILHLYEEYGPDCLQQLRGMFAFAIWDSRENTLFAARDRFGQKPFYYALVGAQILFASEIKSILACHDIVVHPDAAAVDYYLTQRFIPPPLTMIRGIAKLPAGSWLAWRGGKTEVRSYWQPAFSRSPERPDSEWVSELRERICEAVNAHMVSDVPVGAFLSGGLDSSAIVACAVRQSRPSLQSFCIGSDQQSFDERGFARQVAVHCGTVHHEALAANRILESVPALVRCLDEPSDPIAACMYEAARLASRHVKVVLGGDGGDELFGGFDRYAAFDWIQRYAALPRWIREDLIRPIAIRMPETFGYKSLSQRLHWLDAVGGCRSGTLYARMTSYFRFTPAEKKVVYGPVLRRELINADAEEAIARPFMQAAQDHTLHRMLFTDMVTRLPEHTLLLTDRMSMAHGLETRSPFLDHELAQFCFAMPPALKVRHGVTKYALRKAVRNWLPPDVVERSKQGFMFPVAYWLSPGILNSIRNSLLEGPLAREGWIEPTGISRLVEEHIARRRDHHVRIWMLLNLDAWFRIYVSNNPAPDCSGQRASPAHAPNSSSIQ